ncbi:MAG: hypothetical protein IKL24_03390 [Clostridia bacterium]|nr:hypothetical protein [Clostridia bacterium]
MKKLIRFGCLLIVVALLSGCSLINSATKDWQTFNLENCGSIKLPVGWSITESDKYIYVWDDAQNLVMMQSYSDCGISETDPEGDQETNDYYTVQTLRFLSSEVFSNGAIIGKVESIIDEKQCEKLYLKIGYDTEIFFVVYSDEIDYDQLKVIAKTFESI